MNIDKLKALLNVSTETKFNPIVEALKDEEQNNWRKARQINKAAIELSYKQRGITPQQLITKIREYGSDICSHKDNVIMGVWSFLDGDLKAEEEYNKAVKAGATQITIPLEVGETGEFTIACCGAGGDKIMIEPDIIDLTIYEHNVITCPRCGEVWALRNMAAVDTEDNNDQT